MRRQSPSCTLAAFRFAMREPGELLCGAWLRYVEKCDFVIYNHRDEEMQMGEADVIGVRGTDKGGLAPKVFACEVSDHLHGYNDGRGAGSSVERVAQKFERAHSLLDRTFPGIREREFMFWSVRVNVGQTTQALEALSKEFEQRTGHRLTLAINEEYGRRVAQVWELAKRDKAKPFEEGYRLLQLLSQMKGGPLG